MMEKRNWETPRLESIDVEKKTGAKLTDITEYTMEGMQFGQS